MCGQTRGHRWSLRSYLPALPGEPTILFLVRFAGHQPFRHPVSPAALRTPDKGRRPRRTGVRPRPRRGRPSRLPAIRRRAKALGERPDSRPAELVRRSFPSPFLCLTPGRAAGPWPSLDRPLTAASSRRPGIGRPWSGWALGPNGARPRGPPSDHRPRPTRSAETCGPTHQTISLRFGASPLAATATPQYLQLSVTGPTMLLWIEYSPLSPCWRQ